MTVSTDVLPAITEGALSAQRSRLVGLCIRLTGDFHLAEDLAQETLLIGWQQRHQLRDPSRWTQWLNGIARNLCRSWRRCQQSMHPADDRQIETYPAAFDLDQELEQVEYTQLLDHALSYLPPMTRVILVDRYIHGLPQFDVARRLGVSEGVVEARTYRGKLTLRRVLTTEMPDATAELGLGIQPDDLWQPTRIWCPSCGHQRLQGCFSTVYSSANEINRVLNLRCSCGLNSCMADIDGIFAGIRGFQPARKRMATWYHQFFQQGLQDGQLPCPECRHPVKVNLHATPAMPQLFAQTAPALPDSYGFWAHCHHCGWLKQADLESIAGSFPEVQSFVTKHKRIIANPLYAVEAAGVPAVVVGFQQIGGNDRLDLLFNRQTLTPLEIK